MNDEKKITDVNDDKTTIKKTPKPSPKKSSNSDFKRKYFEYYDDIKISDRQDW